MGMQLPKKKGGGMSEINVTPLIDIMLVLLIIFMVITPPTVTEMAANLPSNTETVEQENVPKDQLVAAVCEDGTVALNKRVMPLDELSSQVQRRLRPKAKKVVFVDAHPEAPYDRVVGLMDAVRSAGADRVGLAKLKEPEDFLSCTPSPAAPAVPAEGAAPEAPAG